jgi:30S ribosome assembly GTPase
MRRFAQRVVQRIGVSSVMAAYLYSFPGKRFIQPRLQLNFKRFFTTKLASNCPGCGAVFQMEFPNKPGYLPPIQARIETTPEQIQQIERTTDPLTPRQLKILLQNQKGIVCKRCHSFKSGTDRSVSLKSNRIQFKELKQHSRGLIVMVLDLVDLPGSMIHDITDYVGVKDMIIILNKVDLMPNDMNISKVIEYVSLQTFAKNAIDIFPMSAKKGLGLTTLAGHLSDRFTMNQDCYMVGCTSSGKTTILNQLKTLVGDKIMATTSKQSGTTVGLLRLSSKVLLPSLHRLQGQEIGSTEVSDVETISNEAQNQQYLYDTAGIIHEHQIANFFGEKELSYFSPTKQMLVRVETCSYDDVLFLGGFCRIHLMNASGPVEFRIYGSNKLLVQKVKSNRVQSLNSQIGNNLRKLYPPINSKRNIPFPPLKEAKTFDKKSGSQFCVYYISGAGWFTIDGRCKVKIFTPNGVGVFPVHNVNFFSPQR